MKSDVQILANAWSAAFNMGRIDDLVGYYADGAWIFPPGRPVLTGETALRIYFNGIRAQGFRDYRVRIDDLLTENGMTVATGRWEIAGPGPDGFERRFDGNWLIGLPGGAKGRIAVQMWN